MTKKAHILFCDNGHAKCDVSFPDVKVLNGHDLQQHFTLGVSAGALRKAAKKAGWGRVNGVDYCPACMELL